MNTDKIYAEQLANKYVPKNTSKVVALKKLDAKAKQPASIFAYSFGIVSTLVMGAGICLCMGQIGSVGTLSVVMGVVLGLVGMAGTGFNYPVYRRLLEKGKKKYAFEIVEMAKEISEKGR